MERCAGGEFGAYLVRRGDERAILKLQHLELGFDRIRRSAELAMAVRDAGQLAPKYLDVGQAPDAIYTLQEWVDGEVPARLNLRTAQRMVELLECHRDVATGDGPAGFTPWWDRHAVLKAAGGSIAALGEEIVNAMERFGEVPTSMTDVEHDDYHHKNVMVRGDDVVAIIDWDAARPGDRWRDAFLLMWWSQAAHNDFDDDVAPWLRRQVEDALTHDQLAKYASHNAMRQLEFFQRVYGGEPAEWIRGSIERYMAPYWRA